MTSPPDCERRVGDDLHQADAAAAVDDAVTRRDDGLSGLARHLREDAVVADMGAAEDADSTHCFARLVTRS